jgi:Protein of unknown function (DUF1449)
MTIQWLLGWWNLVFIVPFTLAVLYLGIYTLSGWTFGDTDVDAHVDLDADADVDADVHADADVDADADTDIDAGADSDLDTDAEASSDADADHDADHDTDAHDADASAQPSLALQALSWVGIGKVPASIVLMVLALSWGFIGFVTNQAMNRDGSARVIFFSLPLAAIGSLLVSSGLSRIFARILPKSETYARRRHELLGSVGEALFDIDRRFGMASIRDDRGNLFQIGCRSEGANEAIRKGSHVKLTGYNAKEQLFYVVQCN